MYASPHQDPSPAFKLEDYCEQFAELLKTVWNRTAYRGSDVLSGFLVDFVDNERLHLCLLPPNVTRLTQVVFESQIIRDFILELTDHWLIALGTPEDYHRLVERIGLSLILNHQVYPEYSLMPVGLRDSLVYPRELVLDILSKNPWYMVLVMLLLIANSDTETKI